MGPAGVGLIGLYTNLVQTASAVSALGVNGVGLRRIAAANAQQDLARVAHFKRALFWGTLILSLLGAAGFFIARELIATYAVDDPARTMQIAWLALGVVLTVTAGAQEALLIGLRRTADYAWVNAGAGILGALISVVAAYVWGEDGLLIMILGAPVVTFLLGHFFVARIGMNAELEEAFSDIIGEVGRMVRVGFPFMLSSLIVISGHLLARMIVNQKLGIESLGYFQAAWSIGMTYIGTAFAAMGTDYSPRLTAVIKDQSAAKKLVNDQTDVALLICGPALLLMMGAAPWIITLLYSDQFGASVEILRWQLMGDVFKVICWPLSFILLASDAGKTFIGVQLWSAIVFVTAIWFGIPEFGLVATGIAFLLMHIAILPVYWMIGRRKINFSWSKPVFIHGLVIIALAIIVEVSARQSDLIGLIVGLGAGGGMGLWSLLYLSRMSDAGGPIGKINRFTRRWFNL